MAKEIVQDLKEWTIKLGKKIGIKFSEIEIQIQMPKKLKKNKELFLACECCSEILYLNFDHELQMMDISIFSSQNSYDHNRSIWFKIRTIWNILRYGKVYSDNMIISKVKLLDIKKFIDNIL